MHLCTCATKPEGSCGEPFADAADPWFLVPEVACLHYCFHSLNFNETLGEKLVT